MNCTGTNTKQVDPMSLTAGLLGGFILGVIAVMIIDHKTGH